MRRLIVRLTMLLVLLAPGAALTAGEASAAAQTPMTFTIVRSSEKGCEPDCAEWLMAEGMITQNSPLEFRKALDRMGSRKLPLVLLSSGGNMVAAVEIGYMVRRAGLSTTVGKTKYKGCKPADATCKLPDAQNGVYRGRVISIDSYCLSACPLILASGVKRLASPKSVVGVHQIRSYKPKDKNAKADAIVDFDNLEISKGTPALHAFIRNVLSDYLTTMGVSLDLLSDMDKASGENIYRLSSKRRMGLKLVTEKGGAEALTVRQAP